MTPPLQSQPLLLIQLPTQLSIQLHQLQTHVPSTVRHLVSVAMVLELMSVLLAVHLFIFIEVLVCQHVLRELMNQVEFVYNAIMDVKNAQEITV